MLGPTTPGGGADPAVLSVFQLLTLLSNPDQAKAKLDEITAVSAKAASDRAAADAVIAEAAKLLAEAKKRMGEAEAYAAKTEDQRADVDLTIKLVDADKKKFSLEQYDFQIIKDRTLSTLEARSKELAIKEADLTARTVNHKQAMANMSASTSALNAEAATAREQAQALRDEYESKLAALRQLTK